MSDNLENTTPEAQGNENTTVEVTLQQLTEVIAELQEYRERLLNETLTNAQKAKISKAKTLAQLEPQLADIDATLEKLRIQQAELSDSN